MQRSAQPIEHLVVTGATGRIAGLLRPQWRGVDWRDRDRGLRDLPRGGTVLCLAGVVPGAGDPGANIAIARETVAAAQAAGVARVLLMSSSAVYPAGGPWTEDEADPGSDYGRAKLAMEAVTADTVEICALRLGNVAGADALLSRLGDAPPTLHIWPDGRGPRRGYVGPVTLADMLARLTLHPGPLPRVLNLAQPGTVSMDALLRAAGRDWHAVDAPDTATALVEMDTGRLAGFIALDPALGQAQEVVRQWRQICG